MEVTGHQCFPIIYRTKSKLLSHSGRLCELFPIYLFRFICPSYPSHTRPSLQSFKERHEFTVPQTHILPCYYAVCSRFSFCLSDNYHYLSCLSYILVLQSPAQMLFFLKKPILISTSFALLFLCLFGGRIRCVQVTWGS